MTEQRHISKQWDRVINQGRLEAALRWVDRRRKSHLILPNQPDVLNAFKYTDFDEVKVVIVGQDPYPGKDSHGEYFAQGLAFSTLSDEIPASLRNIFKEIKNEYGYMNRSADLTFWTAQGVLLLNMVLTVDAGEPNSHKDKVWEYVTSEAIRSVSMRNKPTVFMLWGRNAQAVESYIAPNVNNFILRCAHPSPMSADRGFFGCNHFRECNRILKRHGLEVIDWRT